MYFISCFGDVMTPFLHALICLVVLVLHEKVWVLTDL
jgi:hypothetical protein